jgi:hypothetical protein
MARVNVLSCKCEKVLLGVEVGYIGLGRVPSMPQCHDYVLRTFTKVLLSNCQLSRRLSHARTVRVTPIHLTTVTLRISNAIQPLQKGDSRVFLAYNTEAKPMQNIPLLEAKGTSERACPVLCIGSGPAKSPS